LNKLIKDDKRLNVDRRKGDRREKNHDSVKGYKRVKLGIYEDLGDGHMILVEDLVNQLSEEIVPEDSDYIYESLDGGKTVFKRKKGSNKRELVKDWENK